MTRAEQIDKVVDQMLYYGFDEEDALKCATQMFNNGIRPAEGFEMVRKDSPEGIRVLALSSKWEIKPKEYNE